MYGNPKNLKELLEKHNILKRTGEIGAGMNNIVYFYFKL